MVTGLEEDAQAAATALELVANRKLLHILVPLRIGREDNLFVLGCRAARIEREFGGRLVWPFISMALMVEAVASAVAFVEEMVADRLLALKEGNARRD